MHSKDVERTVLSSFIIIIVFFCLLWMLFMSLVCNAKFAQLICTLNINILKPHAFNLEVQHLIPII